MAYLYYNIKGKVNEAFLIFFTSKYLKKNILNPIPSLQ